MCSIGNASVCRDQTAHASTEKHTAHHMPHPPSKLKLQSAYQDLLAVEAAIDEAISGDPQVCTLRKRLYELEREKSRQADPAQQLLARFGDPHHAPAAPILTVAEIGAKAREVLSALRARVDQVRQQCEELIALLVRAEGELAAAKAELGSYTEADEEWRSREDEAAGIKTQAAERGVRRLWHFTRRSNLGSILAHGLEPRMKIDEGKFPGAVWNDWLRLENCREANCVSISHPNYRMFYKYRQQSEGDHEWCVIGVSVSVLWRSNCLYCECNASTAGAVELARSLGCTEQAFESLFADPVATKPFRRTARRSLCIGDEHPSNPQAEVLVFEPIPPSSIEEIVVKDARTQLALNDELQHAGHHGFGRRVKVDESLFGPRNDYSYWS